ncbi:hypothetical protein MSAN_02273800 [Mycena sanguinolenta]|uniref:Uncharacterized protein n=1 Tax=Mycena sanguinolenta TaxID=230812 RepID=A0A8H6XAJ9_9AGAR|nr:hypothetical protein MSAN_02273800 [Mycena sanguinolenta]
MDSQDRPPSKYVGAYFPRARDLVIMGGTFTSVTNITQNGISPVPSDIDEFSSPTNSAKYAGAFFPAAHGLVVYGGLFISVTNIFHEGSAFGTDQAPSPPSPVVDPDMGLSEGDEFASGSEDQVPGFAGAFFPHAQGLIVGGGTFVSITNIIHGAPSFTQCPEFFPVPLGSLLTELKLHRDEVSPREHMQMIATVEFEGQNPSPELDPEESKEPYCQDISKKSCLQSLMARLPHPMNCVPSLDHFTDLIHGGFIQTEQFMQCYQTAILTGYWDTDWGEFEITGHSTHPGGAKLASTSSLLTIVYPSAEQRRSLPRDQVFEPVPFRPPALSAYLKSSLPCRVIEDMSKRGFEKMQAIRLHMSAII